MAVPKRHHRLLYLKHPLTLCSCTCEALEAVKDLSLHPIYPFSPKLEYIRALGRRLSESFTLPERITLFLEAITMRLQIAATALILPFALARSSKSSSAQQIQVYLHPSPTSPHKSVPTLSADQAKAVLNHHLGEHIGDFDEIPADEGMWGHLVGIWGGSGREVDGARVVIVDGGASSQGERKLLPFKRVKVLMKV